jgi:asparagine synthase (glutamine-hydrolysing)
MCGIVGTVNISAPLNLQVIAHRGPDDQGIYQDEHLKLGHVRLSIQDLSDKGHQPFHSEDGNYSIIFNGEIYNQWELRGQLEAKGYNFISTSDTETVLQGFVEYGVKIIPMLNGIFAFCIYDKAAKKIILARDRFGIKPLYYFQSGCSFGFASELKILLELVPETLEVNESALADYIRFLWSPGEATPVKQINKLLQGRYMEIPLHSLAQAKTVQYYKSGFSSNYSQESETKLVEKLDFYLIQAVKRQLLSDVPIAFFLSGGLDSSLLVAVAQRLSPEKKLRCFTIETTKEHALNTDDLYYARKVATHLGVDLEIVKADVKILKDFDKMIYHLDEPLADPAALNVLNISRRAREMGYKVLIGGTAGDDVFSGYRRHQALRYEKILHIIPQILRDLLVKLSGVLPTADPRLRRLRKVIETLRYPDTERMFSYFEWLNLAATLKLFQEKAKGSINQARPFAYFRQLLDEIPNEKNKLNQLLHLEMNTFLVDHNLNYTDKMGMAVGVEIRVPFLDNDLVNFSYSIPPHLKMKGGITKYILKKVAEKYLPREVIYRDKTGFGAPVRNWIVDDLKDMISYRLSPENLRRRGLFDPDEVADLIKQNKERKIDASYSVWALLAIESWLEQFLDPLERTDKVSSQEKAIH